MPRGSTKLVLPISPGGVREDVGPASLPDGTLLSASNFLTRQGLGRPRPGYVELGTIASGTTVTGLGVRGSTFTSSVFVAHTLTTANVWDGSSFSAITGTWTTSTALQPVRMVAYNSGGTLYLVRVNEENAPGKWSGSGSFAACSGSPPKARDITVASRRLMLGYVNDGTVRPYRVQWSGFNDLDAWDADDYADLDETPDPIVAVRALGPHATAIYKEQSVWLATAQAEAEPFIFQLIQRGPGPMGPGAIVPWLGVHYWLASDGAIYRFDGTHVEPVSLGLMTTIRSTASGTGMLRAHGTALALQEPEIWWFYLDFDTQTMIRGVCLSVTTGAVTPHLMTDEITASLPGPSTPASTWDGLTGTWDTLDDLYSSWDTIAGTIQPVDLLGSVSGVVYTFGSQTNDDGTAIPWHFEHGWKAPAGVGTRIALDGVQSLWRKTAASLTVTVGVKITDSLGEAEVATEDTYDLTTDSAHTVNTPGLRGQFVRVRQSGTASAADVGHRHALVLGWPRGLVA